MTLLEAIHTTDAQTPNKYTQEEKVAWLSTVEGMIKTQIIDTHEGGENITFSKYDENTDLYTELLVPHPYDELYIRFLETKINYANGEYTRYNNSAEAFEDALSAFRNYYNRIHMPKGSKFKFF